MSKLLKDITTGALRRKRGAADDLDLSDSDDERMAARRRAKRREFGKMRQALLADEKIGKIAENPKKLAFLRALEDREPDDDVEIDFLQEEEGGSQEATSKEDPAGQDEKAPSGDEAGGKNKRKRPLKPSAADTTNRPPPHLRRTAASKKPATLAEIRESVSFLLEGPNTGEPMQAPDHGDSDEDNDHRNNDARQHTDENAITGKGQFPESELPNPRRQRANMVDRLALLRAASSNSANSASLSSMAGPKMAFHSAHSAGPTGIKPAPLLQRISAPSTASLSRSSSSTSSVNSGIGGEKSVGRGAGSGGQGKKGAVNYYTAAREKERAREMRRGVRGEGSTVKSLLGARKGGRDGGGLGALIGGGQWE